VLEFNVVDTEGESAIMFEKGKYISPYRVKAFRYRGKTSKKTYRTL